jgi:hypothetical protein
MIALKDITNSTLPGAMVARIAVAYTSPEVKQRVAVSVYAFHRLTYDTN